MSEWLQDFAILRHGDEQYKRQVGRVMLLVVERTQDDREKWQARTSDAKGFRVQLTRVFEDKEDAMRAIEKKAAQMLAEAISQLESATDEHRFQQKEATYDQI